MAMRETTSRDGLQLANVPYPAPDHAEARLFGDWEKAVEHLTHHLLTAPECHAWALVIDDYTRLVDLRSADARFHFVEQARASHGQSAQALYDRYAHAVSADLRDASQLEWFVQHGQVTVAMGTTGILVVIVAVGGNDTLDRPRPIVKTAFLAGQGDPEAVRKSHRIPAAERRGMMRERPMRTPKRHGVSGEARGRRQRLREARWSTEERLYYRVFRPSVQHIMRCHHRNRDMFGRLRGNDYALLKDVLPRRSQLKLDHWRELRRDCRGDGLKP